MLECFLNNILTEYHTWIEYWRLPCKNNSRMKYFESIRMMLYFVDLFNREITYYNNT